MKNPPWDQQLARVLVRPLVKSPVTPNQVTVFTIVLALGGSAMIATGRPDLMNWGVGLFVLARFFDHFDGELARQKNMKSKLGYYLDYLAGGLSYGALFLCIGIGLAGGWLGGWAIVLGVAGLASAVISVFLNLGIDEAAAKTDGDTVGYPGFAGFELEDGIYLIAPITWLGWIEPFFILCGIGATVYTLWSLITLLRMRAKRP